MGAINRFAQPSRAHANSGTTRAISKASHTRATLSRRRCVASAVENPRAANRSESRAVPRNVAAETTIRVDRGRGCDGYCDGNRAPTCKRGARNRIKKFRAEETKNLMARESCDECARSADTAEIIGGQWETNGSRGKRWVILSTQPCPEI